jgi:polysaccharide biosynthesis/export protein
MRRGWVVRACAALLFLSSAARAAERSSPTDADYTIGIEDVLVVSVWGEPALNLKVRVRPDGKITIPLVNDIRVEGRTAEEVRQTLTEGLGKYIREPKVTVIVEEIHSFRVYVLGEVVNQGVHEFHSPTRILQALASAGGLTQFSKKEITLLRQEEGVEQRIKVDYKRLVGGDRNEKNIYLKPGDTILVD